MLEVTEKLMRFGSIKISSVEGRIWLAMLGTVPFVVCFVMFCVCKS